MRTFYWFSLWQILLSYLIFIFDYTVNLKSNLSPLVFHLLSSCQMDRGTMRFCNNPHNVEEIPTSVDHKDGKSNLGN